MTVDPTRIECDFCGNDTRGGRSHQHYDSYSDGQVRHLVTSLCCGCECARERAELPCRHRRQAQCLRPALGRRGHRWRRLHRRKLGQLMTGLIFACALLLALAAITDIRAGGLTAWEERDQA